MPGMYRWSVVRLILLGATGLLFLSLASPSAQAGRGADDVAKRSEQFLNHGYE